MVTRQEFESALSKTRSPGQRVAILGALLARESKLGQRLAVVGGSALSLYTGGAYFSKDIDIIGKRSRVTPVLRRWRFKPVGRGSRGYWVRGDLGILVDVIDRSDYVGRTEATRVQTTSHGPVRVAAVEDLIVRRLIFAKRGRTAELLNQAALLWVRFGPELDTEYLDYQVGYEGVADQYLEMRKRAAVVSGR
jgi:hypothetical protein